ncbi:hypothetical protein [Methylobacterium nigriterrae]|uniref:hypothetical protein n=1 Tax=Methylobacterium nigriterrae TaxID=3127512 RepID=UPI0030134F51
MAIILAGASTPPIAKSMEFTRYATTFGTLTWAKYSCKNLKVDNVETFTKLKDAGMKSEDFFSEEFQSLVAVVMIELEKEKNQPKLCELILDQYGPRGRIMPGLTERLH